MFKRIASLLGLLGFALTCFSAPTPAAAQSGEGWISVDNISHDHSTAYDSNYGINCQYVELSFDGDWQWTATPYGVNHFFIKIEYQYMYNHPLFGWYYSAIWEATLDEWFPAGTSGSDTFELASSGQNLTEFAWEHFDSYPYDFYPGDLTFMRYRIRFSGEMYNTSPYYFVNSDYEWSPNSWSWYSEVIAVPVQP
jgi:hypothetical protein